MMTLVSTNLGTMDAPPAVRATRPGWRDPRLWIGVALVVASVLVGARLVGSAQETTEVWAARSDLAVGQPVTTDDLVRTRVHLAEEIRDGYLAADEEPPEDGRLTRPVGAGELVPAGAFEEATAGLIEVPVQLTAELVPDGLAVGQLVDVWVDTGSEGAAASGPVLDDVVVLAVPQVDDGFGGGGRRQVLLGVDPSAGSGIGSVLAAVRDDRVALVRRG